VNGNFQHTDERIPSKRTARSTVLQNLTVSHLVSKFPTHHDTRRFTTAFTGSRRQCLPKTRPSPTPSHPIYLRSIAILPSHSRLGLPSGPFPSGFPTKPRMSFPHTCHMSSPHRPNNFWRGTNDESPNYVIFTILPIYLHIRDIILTVVGHLNTEYSDQPCSLNRVHKACKY
jgi:hypothetical protein